MISGNDIAVKIDGVYKNFKLPHEKNNSLKSAITGIYKKRDKGYEEQHALQDISFEIKKGEFFGIVGRNGSGKSTLLKIIAEIYQPSKGTIKKSGKLVPFIELGVGFNPELTGRENVFLNGAMLGFTQQEIEAMYRDIVEFAELERFMDQKLKNYSSGMQVRLAFSVATRAKAEILLIDEVLAVGDADFQRKCFNYFRSLKNSDTTVIFVSHDMNAVREYCDRAVLINESKLVNIGKPDDIAQQYAKLFMDNADETSGDDGKRWGNNHVATTSVNVKTTNKSITISHTIEGHTTTEDPVVGFRIRSVSGEHVTGTNTKIEGLHIGTVAQGDKITIEWSLPNVLADGTYFVDPSILESDSITVCDWWDEALEFSIKKERNLPYPVDVDFKVAIV